MRTLHPAVWLLPAAMLVVAIFPLPYGYYQLLRVVVFACAALLSWKAYQDSNQNIEQVTLVFGAMALLMNPFLPVELPKLIWMLVDAICAATFVGHYWNARVTAISTNSVVPRDWRASVSRLIFSMDGEDEK